MRRLLGCAVVVLCACGGSPAPSTDLAGAWAGNALSTFAAQSAYAQNIVLEISVSGDTATFSGVCGGGAPIGPGTVNATMSNIGTGTYATSLGTVTCPPRRVANCETVVFTYLNMAALAGATNDSNHPEIHGPLTLSFAGQGSSQGCGRSDQLLTTFIGYLAGAPP